MLEGQRDRNRETEISLHWLPKSLCSHNWVRLGTSNSNQTAHMGGRDPSIATITCSFPTEVGVPGGSLHAMPNAHTKMNFFRYFIKLQLKSYVLISSPKVKLKYIK